MSNKQETNINNEKILTRHNEEERTTLEIEEISDTSVKVTNTQIYVPENNECSNDDLNKKCLQNLDIELENVIVKSNEMDQKCTVVQLVEKDPKTSSIWVQYNQIHEKRTPRKRVDEDSVGAPLSYDPGSRNEFVRIVFVLLFLMLSINAVFGVIVSNTKHFKKIYENNGKYYYIFLSLFVLLTMNYLMTLVARARVPLCNFISFVIVVIAMTHLLTAVTVICQTKILIVAIVATIITVSFCLILACSKFDFTAWYIYVVLVVMVLIAYSIVGYITMFRMGMKFKIWQMVSLVIGTLLQVIVLICALQMILCGGSIEIGEEDYAIAACVLYMSIIDVFLQIIQLMSFKDE